MFNFIHKATEAIEMKIIAALIERVFKNYVSTVLGILLGFAGIVAAVYNLIPITLVWQGHNVANTLLEVASVSLALAGAIAKDKNIGINAPTLPTKVGMTLLMLSVGMLMPTPARAQDSTTTTTTDTSTGFTASSDALALHYNGEWSAATLVGESYDAFDFGKAKSNHVFIKGYELVAPTPGFNIYAAGMGVKPDFSSYLKKTNIPAENLGVEFTAAIGNGIPTNGGSHISAIAGVIVSYRATSALTWNTLTAQLVRYGPNNGVALSTGIAYVFGKK